MKKQLLACMGLLCAILYSGCNGKKPHAEVSAADTVAAITSIDTAAKQVKLIKTAEMRFKARDVKKTSEDIWALTAQFKGMVIHHSMQLYMGNSERMPKGADSVIVISACNSTANMVVKIPAMEVDSFLNQVGKMAVYVNSRNMDIEDRTLDYLSAQMKLISRRELIAQQKKGVVKIKNPAAVMELKDDLIDQQINNKRIDNDVKYSTVGLSFYQSNTITREVVVNDDPSSFKLPFFTRLTSAFVNGWSIFTDTLIALCNWWMFILVIVVGWLLYRYFKRSNAVAVM